MSYARIPFAFPKPVAVYAVDADDLDPSGDTRHQLNALRDSALAFASVNKAFGYEEPIDGDTLAYLTRGDMAWTTHS